MSLTLCKKHTLVVDALRIAQASCDILSFPFPSPFACVTSGPLFPFSSRLLPPFPPFSSLLLFLLPPVSRLLPPFLFPSSSLFLPPSFFLPFFFPFFLLSPLLSSLPSLPFSSVFVFDGCIRSHFGYSCVISHRFPPFF